MIDIKGQKKITQIWFCFDRIAHLGQLTVVTQDR